MIVDRVELFLESGALETYPAQTSRMQEHHRQGRVLANVSFFAFLCPRGAKQAGQALARREQILKRVLQGLEPVHQEKLSACCEQCWKNARTTLACQRLRLRSLRPSAKSVQLQEDLHAALQGAVRVLRASAVASRALRSFASARKASPSLEARAA